MGQVRTATVASVVFTGILAMAGCSSTARSSTARSSAVRTVPDGEFAGTAPQADATNRTVTWNVRCGKTVSGAAIPAGTYVLPVSATTVEVESNPADPAAGHVVELSVDDWLSSSRPGEWTVQVEHGAAGTIRSSTAPSDHDPC